MKIESAATLLAMAELALTRRLFPPPMYKMPNNVFFEITGMLPVVPAAVLTFYTLRFARARRAGLV